MSAPPPSYNDSVGGHAGYQPSYGATNPAPPPPGMYCPPPQGMPYNPQGPPYPQQGGPYHPQYAPVGPVDPSKGYGIPPSYQSQSNTSVIVQTQQPVMVGGCPACRAGALEDDFTCCGVLCAILFFPIGVLCCLAMRQRRCASCGAVFG